MEQDGSSLGEFGLIDWIRARTRAGGRTSLGIGDDCAALRITTGAELLVTTDMLMDGTHFRLGEVGPEAAGYKALAVNLSDIAAMAGLPLAAVAAVALPRASAVAVGRGVLEGLKPLAERFGVELVGGDTNAWDGPLVISVTVLGETTPYGAVRRSGARVGDVLFVTGPLGGSLLGRHLRPWPRIEEALTLNRHVRPHAMIDISDGLASDLGHILAESGSLGALLDADAVPVHPDAEVLAGRDGRSPLDHALNDGEDFELCLALDPADADRLRSHPLPGVSLRRIGVVVESPRLGLRSGDGAIVPLVPRGYDHLASGH